MKNLESEIKNYLTERGWDKIRPCDIAKSISIEAAELLELFQWSNPSLEDTKSDEKIMGKLKKELADILIYALDMAVVLNLDTEKIILDKLKAIKDKYPADQMRKQHNIDTDTQQESEYWRIKFSHRKNPEL